MSLNILSLHKLQEEHLSAIHHVNPEATIKIARLKDAREDLKGTDILLAFGQTDLNEVLPYAPRLKWIHALSAGVDEFLCNEYFKKSDIILTNSRGIHGIPVAEHVLGMMLSFSRCLLTYRENQKNHLWQVAKNIDELYDKTAVIVGLGSIGREIAKRLKSMGMKLFAVKQTQTTEPFIDKLYMADEISQALSQADYIIIALPLTPKTKNLFSKELFNSMKPNAMLINIARGAIVNEKDLQTALQMKQIAYAAIDVFEEEPLPSDSPLFDLPNLLITPHSASSSPHYISRTLKIFTENLSHFPSTEGMINLIDKERGY